MFATTLLSNDMIKAGEALTEKLEESGVSPTAVFWFYNSEINDWKLVIADSKVGVQGPRVLYRLIQHLLAKFKKEIIDGLSLDNIALITPNEPLINLLRSAIRKVGRKDGIRLKNSIINGTQIEDAYIYRLR